MRIAITGSSGFLGTNLIPRLEATGHEVVRVVRPGTSSGGGIAWDPAAGRIDAAAFERIDAVIHLAGRGIGRRRFTAAEKRRLWDSRIDSTTLLAVALAGLSRKPHVLISASAVGYYGDRGVQILDEGSGPGHGFLADLCVAWERATEAASDAGIRVVSIRTGIVLGFGGPLFRRLIPAFRFGFGGRLGDGTQYQPWISLEDHLRAIGYLLESDLSGPANLTAPEPVTNAALVRAIGRAMRRPSIMVVPRSAIASVLGRTGAEDLLASQRAVPRRLLDAGYQFHSVALDEALASIFS